MFGKEKWFNKIRANYQFNYKIVVWQKRLNKENLINNRIIQKNKTSIRIYKINLFQMNPQIIHNSKIVLSKQKANILIMNYKIQLLMEIKFKQNYNKIEHKF